MRGQRPSGAGRAGRPRSRSRGRVCAWRTPPNRGASFDLDSTATEVPQGSRPGRGCDAAVTGLVPPHDGPPFTRGARGGRLDPGPCWPSSPPLPPPRASVPRSHSRARARCPTEAGRGRKHRPHPGRGDASSGRASGSSASGRPRESAQPQPGSARAGRPGPAHSHRGRQGNLSLCPRWAGTGGGSWLAPGPPCAGPPWSLEQKQETRGPP